MEFKKSLSLFLSIVLIVCAVLPTVPLNAVEANSPVISEEDTQNIKDIKNAWSNAKYKKENAFVPKATQFGNEITDNNLKTTYNTTEQDIKDFGDYSFVATKEYKNKAEEEVIKQGTSILLYAPGDSDGSDDNFFNYPYNGLEDVYVNIKSKTDITVSLRYKITFFSPSANQTFWTTVYGSDITIPANEVTKVSGIKDYGSFKDRIDAYINEQTENPSSGMYNLTDIYPKSFYDLRLDIKSAVDENFSLTVGSAVVIGKAEIPEKISTSTDFETVLMAAEKILADPTYINKEELQSVVDGLEVNMAAHAPISAYLTDSSATRTQLTESEFSQDKQSMLTDRDTVTSISFNTQGKTLDIVVNHKSIVKLRKLKAVFSENNISQMKIYGSKTYDKVWTESSRVFQYSNTSVDTEKYIGTDFFNNPREYQYVRFSIKGIGDTVNLTEIQCMCLNSEKNDRSRYCNLISDNPEALTVAEVDKSNNCTVSYPSNNKFGDSIFQFRENTAAICDGDEDTVYDFLGSPSIPATDNYPDEYPTAKPNMYPESAPTNIPSYNLIFELNSPSSVDNIKFVSGSNPEYFPTKVKFYIGDDFDSIVKNQTPIKSFTEATVDGVYEADFTPKNASFVRIEVLENSEQIQEYYGYQILTVVAEIEINGTESVPVTAIDTEGNLINNGGETVYDINLTAGDVKSVTDKIDNGSENALTAQSDGRYKIEGKGKHTVTLTFNDDSSLVLTYYIKDLITEEFGNNINMEREFNNYYSDENNLAKGIEPYVFITQPTSTTDTTKIRKKLTDQDVDTLSNGVFIDPKKVDPNTGKTATNTDISLGGFIFRKTGTDSETYDGDYLNGYNPDEDFTFKENASQYDYYVDIIYDLGTTADVEKVQHFTNVNSLTMGVYEVFVSDNVNNLFNRDKSLVLSYQNKTFRERGGQYSCQQHVFAKKSARFVAFRIYCPVTYSDGTFNHYYNCLRIRELAIYGTVTDDYTVSSTGLETLDPAGSISAPEGTKNLLSNGNLTVSGSSSVTIANDTKLHDGQYGGSNAHTDITGFSFSNYERKFSFAQFGYVYNKIGLKNGYTIDRSDTLGNITFTQSGTPTTYLDFTYDLGTSCIVKQFEMYSVSGDYANTNKTQAYRVYIGDDKTNLYADGNLAAEYENYFNTSGQKIIFNKPKVGKYLGVRILMGDTNSSHSDNRCAKIAEIAAFGNEVANTSFTAPKSMELLKQGIYIENDVPKTAIYLFAEYKTPMKKGTKSADPTKIILDDGTVANVKSRTIYVASKSVYDSLVANGTVDNFGKETVSGVKSQTVNTPDKLAKYWRKGTKDADGYVLTTYGVKIVNIKSETRNNAFAVRAKIVYTVGNKTFTAYSNIQTADNFSSQGAYDVLKKNGQQPSDWFNNGYDDGETNGDNFFG